MIFLFYEKRNRKASVPASVLCPSLSILRSFFIVYLRL